MVCRFWGVGFIQHFEFCSVNTRKLLQTEEDCFSSFSLLRKKMTVGSSFFGGAFFGSPPSPSETSLVGKMCHFSSAVWGVAEVCPLWLGPFHYPPASRLRPLFRQPRSPPCHWTESSFLVVYFPSVQISVSPGWPYFQIHSKLALQHLFAWFGFLASLLPFHPSPNFSPVIHFLLVWC